MNSNSLCLACHDRGMEGTLAGLTQRQVGAGVRGCPRLPASVPAGVGGATAIMAPSSQARLPFAAGVTLATFRTPAGVAVADLAWSPDSRLLAYCTAGEIPDLRVCDTGSQKTLVLYQNEAVDALSVFGWFVSGTSLVSFLGLSRGLLPVLTPANGRGLAHYGVGPGSGISLPHYSFAWSPDGRRLAVAGKTQVVVIEGSCGQILAVYPQQPPPGGQPSYIVAWSPDGQTLASAGRRHAVQLWEAATGRSWQYFPEQGQAIAAAWSPDGRALAYMVGWDMVRCAGSALPLPVRIIVREVETGRQLLVLQGRFLVDLGRLGPVVYPHSLAWSPDSRYLATAGQGAEVQVWEVGSQRLALSYRKHQATVLAVAWSPDGRWIASGGRDGTVRVWRAPGC
ncbi:MAG: PD40 domain-containing protein [Thermogemmatispora sp.]|uniref:WD40 repeat domain-containing protein n=1 Tax=Thermogemmatispora sp. TaxID=1968838 RepID=UPI00261DA8C6|nr:hypothetical protein [Thermogemmatispora sp.]MBX5458961.1 PD40 domain-containing protein [Thermogemmatispora sp.]